MNMRATVLKYVVFIFILTLCRSHTYAFETCKTSGGVDIKWNAADATYLVNTSKGPSESLSAIQDAMQTWTDVPTSNFTFIYGGATKKKTHGINDGKNIVTFGQLSAGTVAENSFWYYTTSGEIIDSDVRFNTYYEWSTTGSADAFDVQNVSTHEHGHSLCLADLYNASDSGKTMYGYVSYGETGKRTLHQDEIDGVTYLYPAPCFPPVMIEDVTPVYYSSLQDAYDDAVNGDVIRSQAEAFHEDLYIDFDKSVILEGGYDCYYTTSTGSTALNGTVIISGGTVTIENFILEQ